MKVLSHLIAWVWLVCAAPLWAQGGYPQSADRFVNDFAGLLNDAQAADIRARFRELNASRGIEAVVVTVRATRDYPTGRRDFDAFARGLFDTWGIGDRARNDGALLLVGLDDRKTRIELGAGYRHRLDGEMRTIVDRVLLPKFRNRQFGEGIVAAAKSMATKLEANALSRRAANTGASANAADGIYGTDGTHGTHAMTGLSNADAGATSTVALLAEAPLPAEAADSSVPAVAANSAAPPPKVSTNAAHSAQGSAASSSGPPVSHSPTTVYNQSHPPPTVYTHSSSRKSARAMALIPIVVVGFLFVAVLAVAITLARRMGQRKCPSCRTNMVLLDEVSDDVYLNSGQQLEEALGSIDYAVHRCPVCGMHSIEPQRRWFSKYSDCPRCGLRALESDRRTLSHPTEYSTGSQLLTRRCRNCDHRDQNVVILPRLDPTRHDGMHGHGGMHGRGGSSHGVGISIGGGHSSHGGGSSSSRHHGGGRSGGGGASGSW
jgi:uncharacterized membrane protein YgcG